ncbi:uncharacterized protein FIBRA_06336 [Fibroporia radiculosa]|uniref:NmrA-like domain-containing protein n=1 Tax=Fibroporia radiculosa TaxID=599839 RepID=J4H409_9APHY|nr:uncharacterized protein FIBRA_06336 [Fibroporia radiculosa]CCM04174.1 predicted protein [Fibroporia radiculosa]
MSSLPLVIVLGATGRTGKVIIDALLESGNFRVGAITRTVSVSRPEVEALRVKGVEIRAADISSDGVETLKETLSGAEVLISAVSGVVISDQKSIIAAAKEAGVKRVIPCDFGTPGSRGVRELHDSKLDIREYIQKLGIGYTFIDVGWWMQLTIVGTDTHPSFVGPRSHEIYGAGDKKLLLTDLNHIGRFVAKIVIDKRALNQYVIVWEDEKTFLEAKEISERVSGEGETLKAKRSYISRDEVIQRGEIGRANEKPNDEASYYPRIISEYIISLHFLGENSLENAKALGALDAKELYPDVATNSFEEYASKFYSS